MQKEFDKQLEKHRRQIKLPGFRPGKVPAKLIKQRFGDAIKAELVDEVVQNSFREACTENTINPVSQAQVNDIKYEEGEPLTVSIEVQVDPEIEIKGYDKLKVKAKAKKIKDSEIDKAVEDLLDKVADFKDVERPAKKGDYVRFEYKKVVVDGEEQQNVQNPQHPVELGSEADIKEFEEGLTGRSKGDDVAITVTFPDDYRDPAVAGKTGEFKMLLTNVQEKTVPQIDKALMEKLGAFDPKALEEAEEKKSSSKENPFEKILRERIRQDMEKQALEQAKGEAHMEAIDAIIKDNPFEVPQARVEAVIDYMVQEASKYNPNQPPPSREEIEQQHTDTAVRSIKQQRIVDYVANKEKIKATQQEVDQEIMRIAMAYQQDFETFKNMLRKNGTTNKIRADIREKKTLDYLIGELKEQEKQE